MKQNNKKSTNESFNIKEEFLKKEHPLREQIIWAVFWTVLGFLLSIPFYFNDLNIFNDRYAKALNSSSIIIICIATLWLLLKFGVFENSLYKYKNNKFKKLSNDSESVKKQDKEISIEEYRMYRKKQTFWGPVLLIVFWTIVAIVTLIIII